MIEFTVNEREISVLRAQFTQGSKVMVENGCGGWRMEDCDGRRVSGSQIVDAGPWGD